MGGNEQKPIIRFRGFTDSWEQRKLGEVASSFEYGLNAAAKEFDGMNKYLRITDIDDLSRSFRDDDLTSPDTDLSTASNYQLREGEIVFARTGASVGKSFIYRESDGLVYFAGFLIRAKIKPEYDSEFVFQNTLGTPYEKYIQITSQRSGQPGVNAQEYAEYAFLVPDYAEQKKIGSFLRQIDNLITLHQRKHDKLMNVKKSMLEKMFPQDGSLVPEIRFAGFTDAWEQRKLSDLAEIIGGGTPDTNIPAYWDGDIDWYAPAEMEGQRYASSSVRKITELGLQKSSAKMLPAQRTVLFTSRAGIGKMAILQRPAATNQGFQSLVLKDGTEPYFIYSMGVNIKEMAEGVASGSTFLEISGKMLGNLEVMVPTLKEQEAIAAFFRNIDDLITLHQRELEKLKNIKKSMLDRMFV